MRKTWARLNNDIRKLMMIEIVLNGDPIPSTSYNPQSDNQRRAQ